MAESFRIVGAIRGAGRVYRTGDEAAFIASSPRPADVARLAEAGVVDGDLPAGFEDGDSDALPTGFPGLKALLAADKITYTDLAGTTRADLVAIPGVKERTADAILKALKARE
jgi:hypothetical protein